MKMIMVIVTAVLLSGGDAFAGEIDALVNKLVENGTITALEGREIITNTQEEQKSQIAKGKHPLLPKWLQTLNIKGDFRFRYQIDDKEGSVERERERLRLRLGIEGKVADSIKIITGLATGATDPRSTNQTLENNFEPKNINLDYMYADMVLTDNLNMGIGKMKHPLFNAGDLLWDTDINPEGLYASLNFPSIADSFDFSLTGACFMLDELSAKEEDPSMYALQTVFKAAFTENTALKAAVAYYGYNNTEGVILDKTAGTNSGISKDKITGLYTGGLKYEYDAVKSDIEFGIDAISDVLPYIAVFGEYLSAGDPADNNKGHLYGIKLGHAKVSDPGQWQVQVSGRELEKDACPDIFPDSDFYGGKTNVKGYEIILAAGLYKNTSLNLDYYSTENMSGTIHEEKIYQADINYKF